jgi:hypothetical protein
LLRRRGPLLIILAWLALGPISGGIVGLVTGEARETAIMFSTGGGLLGGGLYWLGGGADAISTALCALAGALALVLFYHALTGLIELPVSN